MLERHSLEVVQNDARFYLLFRVDVQGLEDSSDFINYSLVWIVLAYGKPVFDQSHDLIAFAFS